MPTRATAMGTDEPPGTGPGTLLSPGPGGAMAVTRPKSTPVLGAGGGLGASSPGVGGAVLPWVRPSGTWLHVRRTAISVIHARDCPRCCTATDHLLAGVRVSSWTTRSGAHQAIAASNET